MEFNTEVRKKQLDNLDQLISSSRKRIQSVLSYLGWSEENVKKEEHLVQCPINAHHRIDPKSWTEHMQKCALKFEGYDQKSQFLSESLDNPSQSIYLDHNKKVETITKELSQRGATLRLAWNGLDPDPKTADRWITTYSPDERLVFYQYCIENTTGPPEPPEFTTIVAKKQDEEKSPSYKEILSQQRDAKRRRAKYKSVHINRKNHTEVMREVINGQMEEYKDWLLAQEQTGNAEECNKDNEVPDEKKEDHERPHSSISKTSNHSSSSRSTNRRYDRDRSDRYRNGRERSRERHDSRHLEQRYKRDDRHRKVSPNRRSDEGRRPRSKESRERKRSEERDRRYSSGERSSRHSHDGKRR